MLDLNADVAFKLLLANIQEHLLERKCFGLLDVVQAPWLPILVITGVVVSLYDKVIVRPQDSRDEITDDVFEELEFGEALLAELSYIMAYQYHVCCLVTFLWNGSCSFERKHAYMSSLILIIIN